MADPTTPPEARSSSNGPSGPGLRKPFSPPEVEDLGHLTVLTQFLQTTIIITP